MDSLKTLIAKGEYDLVLGLTAQGHDPEAVAYRVAALTGKGRGQEALALLLAHRDALYAYDPRFAIKADMELRFLANEFAAASADAAYFSAKPYVSQEIEEILRSLPDRIQAAEKAAQKPDFGLEDVGQVLSSSPSDREVMDALSRLQGDSASAHAEELAGVLGGKRHPYVRAYALLLLVSIRYPKEVVFRKGRKKLRLIPKDLEPPYTGPVFEGFRAYLAALAPDPSLGSLAERILGDCILASYPDPVLNKAKDPLLAGALLLVAARYLRAPEELALAAAEGADRAAIAALAAKIAKTIEGIPPLGE